MRAGIEYEDAIMSINEEINRMAVKLQGDERTVLRKIGALVKRNVVRFLHDSDVELRAKQVLPGNYDGSRPYTHMKDDVKYTVKKDKFGNMYVSTKGGRHTGYKWAPVDAGHIARDVSTFIPGTNFVGKAVNASEGEVDKMINDLLKKVVE